jgi:hypothetical protein
MGETHQGVVSRLRLLIAGCDTRQLGEHSVFATVQWNALDADGQVVRNLEYRAWPRVGARQRPDAPVFAECPFSGLGGGQRALEGGPVARPAVRRKYVLDRQCE